MSFEHPLRGACACRRNQYFIQPPHGVDEIAQVLFGTGSSHRIAQANPLSAHIRVPLEWYHSATFSFFPDETAAMIRRVYDNPFEGHTRRHFCGFCGTPLSYWSESPRGEANYIQVTMGSLCREDLGDLEELGLIPETAITSPGSSSIEGSLGSPLGASGTLSEDDGQQQQQQQQHLTSPTLSMNTSELASLRGGRESTGIPWFDSILEGSRLGKGLKSTKISQRSADGTTRVEWEIVEYTDGDPGTPSANGGKRKMDDRDDTDDSRMEGIHQ